MAATIAQVVARFKKDVGDALSPKVIQAVCDDLEHSYRHRLLDPVNTVNAFLVQILHGNVACTAVPRLTRQNFTGSAYCKARGRLPLALFENLFDCVSHGLYSEKQTTGLWFGHCVWTLDGSSFSMSDEPELQKYFGQPSGQKPGCGFPVAHVLALFHAGAGFLQRTILAPMRTHDMANAARMIPEMDDDDILLADRAFASFAHLAMIFGAKRHAVFRCHQNQIVNFQPHRKHRTSSKDPAGLPTSRWLKRLGKHDQLVEYVKQPKPDWMTDEEFAALPETVVIRELRVKIKVDCRVKTITLVTTLLDPVRYPAKAIAALYGQRWEIETNLKHLKTTMRMEVLHCRTVVGVKKEIAMFALAYNLVRLVMLEASRRQKVLLSRISFIDALRWLRSATPNTSLGKLVINPYRPGRIEPRAIKRRPKEYDRLNKPRKELRKIIRRNDLGLKSMPFSCVPWYGVLTAKKLQDCHEEDLGYPGLT
jgi:Transposase DDE domain